MNNPPAEVHPVSAANRPGAVVAVPPPEYYNYIANTPSVGTLPPTLQPPNTFALGQRPQRLLPILAEPDPHAALGIRAGSFLLLPSLDLSAAYSTNPEHVPGGPPSAYAVAAPELILHRARHEPDRVVSRKAAERVAIGLERVDVAEGSTITVSVAQRTVTESFQLF